VIRFLTPDDPPVAKFATHSKQHQHKMSHLKFQSVVSMQITWTEDLRVNGHFNYKSFLHSFITFDSMIL
jgi:hypothetical protein